jgi:hypothetical protein
MVGIFQGYVLNQRIKREFNSDIISIYYGWDEISQTLVIFHIKSAVIIDFYKLFDFIFPIIVSSLIIY